MLQGRPDGHLAAWLPSRSPGSKPGDGSEPTRGVAGAVLRPAGHEPIVAGHTGWDCMAQGVSRRSLLLATGATLLGSTGVGIAAATASAKSLDRETAQQPPGPSWGLLIDRDACSSREGCRACIEACHGAHQVRPQSDPRHEVKWLWKEPFSRTFPEAVHPWMAESQRNSPVLVLCNHCENPPCARVCPTTATWRRPDGVVAMDAHRCIGCRYCMAACPYGARSFNWERPAAPPAPSGYPRRTAGVVEKCTLCVDRLDAGELPLCVTACHRSGGAAMTFGDLSDPSSKIRRLLGSREALRRRPSLGTEPRVYYLS